MANDQYQFNAAAPIAASGLDVDKLMAGDPDELAKANSAGIPLQSPRSMPLSARNLPAPSGTSATQKPVAAPAAPYAMPAQDGSPMSNFGSNLAQAGAPATNSPNGPSEPAAKPAVPSTIAPGGTNDDPNQAGIQRAGAMAENFATKLAAQPTLAQEEAPIQAKRTLPPQEYDPAHPEYRPSVGRRIARGFVAAGEGLAEHGLFGAALGALDPEKVGATPYSAPTRQFSVAAQQQAAQAAALDKQQSTAEKTFTEDTGRAKDVLTSINDIGKTYAEGQSAQARTDVAQARKETADVQGQLADIKQQVADYQNGHKVPTTYEATVAASELEQDPTKKAALKAAAKTMEATKFKEAAIRHARETGGNSEFRQSMIEAAAAQVQALQDKYDYDPRRNQYVNHENPNDVLTPNEFTDKKNEISTKLDQQLEQKKMAKLGVKFNPADAGAGKPSGRAQQRAAANKPKPPTPTQPAPGGAADMALGSDGQYHYRDANKRDLGVVK